MHSGEPGDDCYLIERGIFEATLDDQVVAMYKRHDFFGERALLQNAPRAATVTCKSAGVLWALDRSTFRGCVMTLKLRAVVSSVPYLSHLTDDMLERMADAMFEVPCSLGDVIIEQGDPGDNVRALTLACTRPPHCTRPAAPVRTPVPHYRS